MLIRYMMWMWNRAGRCLKMSDSKLFFEALGRRIEEERADSYRFQIHICDHLIELRFPSRQDAEWIENNLVGRIAREGKKPDAVFQFWTADYARYVGAKNALRQWKHQDERGYMECIPGWWFMGVDLSHRIFYYCRSVIKADIRPYGIIQLFYRWARTKDMLLLHGAVVGSNGRGVLIAAQGGGGKSSLSVSCLLAGMDFISDDHFLVNAHGSLRAFPLYKTVKLNRDMMEKINPDMPVIWTDSMRNYKKTLDASGSLFCRELLIKEIIWPRITNCEEPEIIKTEPYRALNELVHSTLQQIGFLPNAEAAHAIMARLYGLPVFEMRLSRDLSKNVVSLRRFIERNI